MTFVGPANWNAAIGRDQQTPAYIAVFDGLTDEYATHRIKGATPAKKVYLNTPAGGRVSLDLVAGSRTVQEVEIEILDLADEITTLVATEASGAPLSTLVNRKVTIKGGYVDLDESDYPAIYTGRLSRVRMNRNLTGYIFRLSDMSYLLDGEIMSNATPTKPATIRGNLVNVYWSILSGTFSTVHATFPLDFVSTDGGASSAPTGLGIPTSLINETLLVAERDAWHPEDVVEVEFIEAENAAQHLTDELFRVFQCFPAISGEGKIGLKFHVPALPASAAPKVTTLDHIVTVRRWERLFKDHLNKFTIKGDWNKITRQFDATLYNTETSEDTTDQNDTDETIEYLAESRWLKSAYNGAEIAFELAGRMRIRFLKTPVLGEFDVTFKKRNLEQGDVIAITDERLPNLFTGDRGLTDHMMTVLAIRPNFERGLLGLTVLDTGYKRYGLMTQDSQANYATATAEQRNEYFFIGSDAGLMSDGSESYRFI